MGYTMEYMKKPSSLLPNRKENFEEDVLFIIESGDFTSYEAFKVFWARNSLSMIHHSVRPKEQRNEFYLTLYSILTEFIRTSQELGSKAVFVLFTIYFTQHKKPVLIPLSPATVGCLNKIALSNNECKNLIGKLARCNAFDYCVLEGVKSYFRPKRSHAEKNKNSTLDPELIQKTTTPVGFNVESLHNQAINYMYSKDKVTKAILENISMFKHQNLPQNEIAAHFSAENVQMLNLSNSAFPLMLASKFSTLEKLLITLKSKN